MEAVEMEGVEMVAVEMEVEEKEEVGMGVELTLVIWKHQKRPEAPEPPREPGARAPPSCRPCASSLPESLPWALLVDLSAVLGSNLEA